MCVQQDVQKFLFQYRGAYRQVYIFTYWKKRKSTIIFSTFLLFMIMPTSSKFFFFSDFVVWVVNVFGLVRAWTTIKKLINHTKNAGSCNMEADGHAELNSRKYAVHVQAVFIIHTPQ